MICQLSVVTEGKKGKVKIWIVDGEKKSRPSHDLLNVQYRELLPDVYDSMPSDVECALENVSKPNGVSYIDYRYSTDSELSGLNYDKWLDDFYLVYNFLTDIKHNI